MTTTYLIIAHLLADFIFQPNKLIKWKMRSFKGVLFHVVIFAIASGLLLFPYLAKWETWMVILVISMIHFIIDQIKINIALKYDTYSLPFIADQAIHFLSLILGGYYLSTLEISLPNTWFFENLYTNLAVLFVVLMIIFVIYSADILFVHKAKSKKRKISKLISFSVVYIIYISAALLLINL